MQNLFLDGYVTEPAIIESSFTRKFCGIMSLRAGCACACLVWIGIGLYGSILAFQYKSPIFSYISSGALIAQGVICLLLVIAAGAALAGLYGESMVILNHAHRYIWLMVIAFLIDFLVTIVIFGIEQQDNSNWCYDESYNHVDDQAAANGNTTVVTYAVPGNVDFYNCSKIWQDELKFAIALMVIFLIFFLYWAWCLWAYAQKLRILSNPDLYQNQFLTQEMMGFPAMPAGMAPPPMDQMMMNMPAREDKHGGMAPGAYPMDPGTGQHGYPAGNYPYQDDNEQSLAQMTRNLFAKFKS